MLFGPDGKPLPVDTRTPEQREFDRKFRAQMADNGGQHFKREFITEVKRQFDVRARERAERMKEPERNPKMDLLSDMYDEKSKTPKNRVWTFPK
jgi:hypothetical protein